VLERGWGVYGARYRRMRVTVIFGGIAAAAALLFAPAIHAAGGVCHLQGDWLQTTAGQSSTWHISSNGQATESGLGSAHGTATLVGNVLTIESFPSDPTFNGVYKWTLDSECHGTGTLTFTSSARAGQTLPSTVVGPPPTAVKFSFHTYANDVRVVPPLVGPWQLGFSHFIGSGTLGSTFSSSLYNTFAPHSLRYPFVHLSAVVVGYSYYSAPNGSYKTLDMTIQVTDSNAKFCTRGDRGTLKLLQTTQRLKNGALGDAVGLSWPSGRCPTFYQGWINSDGGAKTSPPTGGPPSGGQWAIVNISP